MEDDFMMTRRTMVEAAALAAGVALAGCSGSDNSSSGSSDGGSSSSVEETAKELSLYPTVSPATLDPQNDSDYNDAEITALLGEGLFRYGSDGTTLENAVCESYTAGDDGLTYTFTLGESYWQDGTQVVAGDFVYSIKRFFDPALASENAFSFLSYIDGAAEVYNGEADVDELGVSAPDDSTFVVVLGSVLPEASVKSFFSIYCTYPMNQVAIEAGGDGWSTNPEYHLSNGPYILSEYNADETIILEKNDAYVGSGTAYATKITFQLYADSTSAEVAMLNGDIDYYKTADESLISQVDESLVIPASTLTTSCLFINWRCPPMDDVRVRQAIYMAIDEEYTNETLEYGYATVAEGIVGEAFTDPAGGSFRTDDNSLVPSFSEDRLAQAQELLAEAGYPGGEGMPTLVYLTANTVLGGRRAEFFQAMLQDNLGLDIEVESYDVPTYLSLIGGSDYAFSYMTMNASCDNVIEMLSNFITDSDLFGISIQEYDDLYEEYRYETDPEKQSELMHEAEELLLNEYYAFRPIVYAVNLDVVSEDVDNLVTEPAGNTLHNFTTLSTW